jgi:acyl-[acyl-carrier-protein]-phospholipid O-acyltransferase/long-chain-fatty-acid--[acyl-carrier-protein] ligase
MSNLTSLFKTRRFLPLFITQFFGAFNDNVFKNALLIWFTYAMVESSVISAPLMVMFAAGIYILPFFLFSAMAGQLADKYEKTFLVKNIKLIEILLMLVGGVGFYLKSVPLLLIILFLMGVHSTFFGPIKYSLLPDHLKNNELVSGNALIEGGTFLSILLGTIFGGLVIMLDYGILLVPLAAVLFAVIGYSSSYFIPKTKVADPDLKIAWNIFRQTCVILKYSKKEKKVWWPLLGISWMWFMGAMFLMEFPTYTKEIVSGDEHVVTLFLTLFSLGIGIGSGICNRLLKGEISVRLVPLGGMGMSLCMLVFCIASYFYSQTYTPIFLSQGEIMGVMAFFSLGICSWVIALSLLGLAIFTGIYIVPLYVMVQHYADTKYISRVIAANNIMNSLLMVGASLMSMLLFALGLQVIDILLCVALMSLGVYFFLRKINRTVPE